MTLLPAVLAGLAAAVAVSGPGDSARLSATLPPRGTPADVLARARAKLETLVRTSGNVPLRAIVPAAAAVVGLVVSGPALAVVAGLGAVLLVAVLQRRVRLAALRSERLGAGEACAVLAAELRAGRSAVQALEAAGAVAVGPFRERLLAGAAAARFGGDTAAALREGSGGPARSGAAGGGSAGVGAAGRGAAGGGAAGGGTAGGGAATGGRAWAGTGSGGSWQDRPARGRPGASSEATGVPEVAAGLAACWSVCAGTGSGLAAAVERLEQGLRGEAESRRAVDAELAGPRATAGLLAVLPLAGIGLAAGLGARPVHVLLETTVGGFCLVLGVALDLLGLAWSRRIARAAGAD